MSKTKGFFFTFEGIDRSGKSLQCERLVKRLKDEGFSVLHVREPGGTNISERIRDILLDLKNHQMAPITELLLYTAARCQLVTEMIKPALNSGEIVISDRFLDSTIAYQGYGRDLNLSSISMLNQLTCNEVFPDRTYFLDISWQESINRCKKGRASKDRMENQDKPFFERIRKGYLDLSKNNSERFLVLDGSKKINPLAESIYQDAKKLIINKS